MGPIVTPQQRRNRNLLGAVFATLSLAVVALALWTGGGIPASSGYVAVSDESLPASGAVEPASESPTSVAVPRLHSDEATPGVDDDAEEPERSEIVIAWQPSHQGDTGYRGWEEYAICGDIVDRAMADLAEYSQVKAWETGMGLTGSNSYERGPSNVPAFDSELAQANAASADLFVSIHNDGGAPSGVLGICMPGDAVGRTIAEMLVRDLCSATGLPDRGVREVRLYSLESPRNEAAYRCLLEIGDNESDRVYLVDPDNRQTIADGLSSGVRRVIAEVIEAQK